MNDFEEFMIEIEWEVLIVEVLGRREPNLDWETVKIFDDVDDPASFAEGFAEAIRCNNKTVQIVNIFDE